MAIKYLNSNIIKMYYGGNAITQAYLNGDHFLPVSNEMNWTTADLSLIVNTPVSIDVGFRPKYVFMYCVQDDLTTLNLSIVLDFMVDGGFVGGTQGIEDFEIWSTSGAGGTYTSSENWITITDTGIQATTSTAYDEKVVLLSSDTTSGKTYSNYATGTVTMTDQYVNVTDLSFVPKFIVIHKEVSAEGGTRPCHYMVWNVNQIPVISGNTTVTYGAEYLESDSTPSFYLLSTDKYTVTNNSFNFRTSSSTVVGDVYRWEVWGDDNLFNLNNIKLIENTN